MKRVFRQLTALGYDVNIVALICSIFHLEVDTKKSQLGHPYSFPMFVIHVHADYKSVLRPYCLDIEFTSRNELIHRDRWRFLAYHLANR